MALWTQPAVSAYGAALPFIDTIRYKGITLIDQHDKLPLPSVGHRARLLRSMGRGLLSLNVILGVQEIKIVLSEAHLLIPVSRHDNSKLLIFADRQTNKHISRQTEGHCVKPPLALHVAGA